MIDISDIPIVLILTILFSLIVLFFLILSRKRSKLLYDHEHNRVQIEMLRQYFESKIYNLTDRMTVTEDRWKDINHLIISSQQQMRELSGKSPNKTYLTNFLKSNNITEEDIEIDNKLVFVLTPFHEKYYEVFKSISNICRKIGIQCLRGDEDYINGNIFQHLLHIMLKSRLVIAIINGRNPNVFYELGIAQALDKDTIIVSKTVQNIPFDIKSNRIIIYKELDDLKGSINEELLKLFSKV